MAYFTSYMPSVCYSSELSGISCSVTPGTVTLLIQSPLEVFSNTYNTPNSYINFPDFSDVVEMFMEQQKLTVADMQFIVTDAQSTAEKTIRVVYFKEEPRKFFAADILSDGLLTTYRNRVVYEDSVDYLTFWCEPNSIFNGTTVRLYVLVQDYTGHREWILMEYGYTIHQGINELMISFPELRRYLPDRVRKWDILFFSFTVNQQTCNFYVGKAHNVRHFIFRNCYNAKESISVPCISKNITETKSSLAICGKKQYRYDIQHTRSFEQQTAALDSERAAVMEQMLTSPSVQIVFGYAYDVPIIITSYDYELSDEPNTERTFKFEWQYENRNGVSLLEFTKERIFSEHFTPPFV